MSDDRPKLERPARETLARLLSYMLPYRRRVIGVIILMFVTSSASLIAPVLVRQAINRGLSGDGDLRILTLYSLALLATNVVQAVGLRLQMFNMVWMGQHAIMQVRQQVFFKYLDLNMAYYDHNRVGDLMARITEDSNSLQNFITWAVINTIANAFTLVGIIAVMLYYDWSLALLTFLVIPAMTVLTLWWRKRSEQRYRAVREAVGVVSATLQENLSGMRIVQAFVREYRQQAQFEKVATDEMDASLRADKLASIYMPGIDILSDIGVAIVIGVGGLRVLHGDLDTGTLVAFLLYLNMFFNPIRDLAMRLDQFQEAAAAGERILKVIDTAPDIVDAPGAAEMQRVAGAVELRGVSFFYEKPQTDLTPAKDRTGSAPAFVASASPDDASDVLQEIDLVIQPGQMVALVGHTGAGKSTLVRLLGRFYVPQTGQILFDGQDISQVTLTSLRAQIAWVPQDTGLFATTVKDNLRYGRLDATDEQIEAAARATGAHDFIAAMPKGYETDVEEGGSRLSTGQRQLISFTRALLADPAIIILDEATSSVDTITELQMQAALGKLLEGRTAVVIAHRLSTIIRADQVIVMDHGRIIERGTHSELLAARGHYHDLYTTQLRGGVSEN